MRPMPETERWKGLLFECRRKGEGGMVRERSRRGKRWILVWVGPRWPRM